MLQNGEAVGIRVPAGSVSDEDFYGSFKVTLSDNSVVNWQCVKNQHPSEHYYDFDFVRGITPSLTDGKTVTGYSINIPYNTGKLSRVNLTRNTLATTVRMRAVDEGTAWDNLYPESSIDPDAAANSASGGWKDTQLGVESLTFGSDSALSLTGYVSYGGRFYIEETNSDRRIKTITVSKASDGSDVTSLWMRRENGKYMIHMPDYAINIAVESEALPVHKLTIEATTPDYFMNGFQQVDSLQAGSIYSADATRLRFFNDRCTSARANGNETKRDYANTTKKTEDYYKLGDFTWWTSILAYAHEEKWNLTDGEGPQFLKISNVRFYKMENASAIPVSESSVGFSTGVQSGRPYIRFIPQDYDMKVTFDVTERPEGYEGWHRIFLHEKRPSTEDTVWCNYFYQKGSDPIITYGNNKNRSYSTNDSLVPDNSNPMSFEGTENIYKAGRFKTNGLYTYGLKHVNGRVPHSTLVKSWKVYKANADGTSTGEEVILTNGTNALTFAGWDEGDYLIARDTTDPKKNKAAFEAAPFKMPDCDIVIEIEFGKTVSPCNIIQRIADENGAYQPISEDIDVTFTGTPRDNDTHAFYEGDTVTVSKANNYIGYYKGTKDVSFMVNPPAGYVVSDVEYYIDYQPSSKYKDLVRNGNTFTIPNKNLLSEENGNPTYKNGVGFGVTISYSKFVPITVNQQVDGTPMPGSDAAVGTVTLSSKNSGTFMDASLTGTPVSSFTSVLTKSESAYSADAMASLGSKLSIDVLLSDNTRVINSVEIIRTRNGVDETLVIEPTKYVQNEAVFDLPEGLGLEDSFTVNVIYKTVQRLSVDIVVKDPGNSNKFIPSTTTATATVTAVDSTTGDAFEKFPVEADSACDSFTVSGSAPARYLTRGNQKIKLEIRNLPAGYVVANVMAVPMKDDGEYNSKATTNAINPSTTSIGEYNDLRSYATCTMTIPDGQNYYIRVFLAQTASVTVRLQSRGSSVDALFADNSLANTYAVFSYSNSNYGVNFYPVIITNATNKYNTDTCVIDNNPASRTVDVVERTQMSGAVTMPKGYIIASIVATRTYSGGTAETMKVKNGSNAYKKDDGKDVFEQKFSLNDDLLGGYDYTITVNIEQATLVKFRSLHINENGVAVPNTINNSQSALSNTRGAADAAYPYNIVDYQSEGSIASIGGVNPQAFVQSLTTIKSDPERERYVLRNSDFVVTATPTDGDEVASVVAYDADVPDTKYECELIGNSSNGKPQYKVPLKSAMNSELVIDVTYTAERKFGKLRIINRDIYDNLIDNPGTINLQLNNAIFSKPGHIEEDSTWFKNRQMTESDLTYEITMGSTVKLETYGGGYYSLSHMTLDGTMRDCAKDNRYQINITLRENETVTVVNYFAHTAMVRQSAYYSDLEGNVSPPVIRFNNKSGYIGLTSYAYFMKNGEQVFNTSTETSGKALVGNFAAGENSEFHTIIREQAGYVLDHLELSGPHGDYTLTRAQITGEAVPERGQNNIYISWDDIVNNRSLTNEQLEELKQSFKQLTPGETYYITAYFTTRVIHVSARDVSYEEFQRIEEEEEGGFAQYVKTHTVGGYHDPSRVADVGAWSIDGKNDVYYVSDHQNGDMGVRPGSSPVINVHPQYKKVSSTTVYYRVGAVFYGPMNLETPRALPTQPPVPFGVGATVNSEPVNQDMYLTVIYIIYTEDNIKPPSEETYDDAGTVWKTPA